MSGPGGLRGLGILTLWAWRAAVRAQVFALVGVLGLVLVGASLVFRSLSFGGQEGTFLTSFGLGVVFLFGTVLAVLLPTLRWAEELAERTAMPVLARPVGRGVWVVAQWAGAALALAGFVAVLGGVLAVLLIARGAGLDGLGGALGLQAARLGLIAALAILVSALVRGGLLAATLTAVLVLVGQLVPLAQGVVDDARGGGGSMAAVVVRLVPNLGAFAPEAPLGPLVLYALGYAAVYLGLAAALFRRRDL